MDHPQPAPALPGQGEVSWQDAVCDRALSWINTPYVPRARVNGVGADCGTFLYDCYEPQFGPFKPLPIDYAVDWAAHKDAERYLDFIMPYVKSCAVPVRGGFSLFHVGLAYSHAAIYLGGDRYIHAWGRKGAGAVMITPKRVMLALSRDFPVKHFEPK